MDKKAKSQPTTPGPVKNPPIEKLEIGGAIYQTRLTAKFRNRIKWKRPDVNILTAVIPGTVQQIMVKEGAKVAPGTPVLILEAMKMRNVIVSPVSGSIKKIFVSQGEQVSKHYHLVEFE